MALWQKVNALDSMKNRQKRISDRVVGQFDYDEFLDQVGEIKKHAKKDCVDSYYQTLDREFDITIPHVMPEERELVKLEKERKKRSVLEDWKDELDMGQKKRRAILKKVGMDKQPEVKNKGKWGNVVRFLDFFDFVAKGDEGEYLEIGHRYAAA